MRVVGLLLLAACCGVFVSGQDIVNPDPNNTFHITGASGIDHYIIGGLNDPTLNMTIGTTYYISIDFANSNHPFGLNLDENTRDVADHGLVVQSGSCTGSNTTGVVSGGAATPCVLAFTPNQTAQLFYHCTLHANMVGRFQVNAGPATTAPTTAAPVNNATTAPTTAAPVNNGTTAPTTAAPVNNATTAPTTAAPVNNATTAPPTAPAINADSNGIFHVTGASGIVSWIFNSGGTPVNNPTLNMDYGKTYTISIEFDSAAGNHPFGLSRASTGAIADLGLVNVNASCGTSNNGFTATQTCLLTFTPPANTPQPLYYRCTVHEAMSGQIVVSGLPKSGGFALVPGFAVLFAVVLSLFAAAQ